MSTILGGALTKFNIENANLLFFLILGLSWHYFDWHLKTIKDYQKGAIIKSIIIFVSFIAKLIVILFLDLSIDYVLWLTVIEYFLSFLSLGIRGVILASSDTSDNPISIPEYTQGEILQIALGGWLSYFLMQWPMLLGESIINADALASFYILSRFYEAGAIVATQMNTRMYVKYASTKHISYDERKTYLKTMFLIYLTSSIVIFCAFPILVFFGILDLKSIVIAFCLFVSFFPYFLTSFRNSWYLVSKEFTAITVHGVVCISLFLIFYLGIILMFGEVKNSQFLILIILGRFLPFCTFIL